MRGESTPKEKNIPVPPVLSLITRDNVGQAEKLAMESAAITISALDEALACWEAAKEKPEDLKGKAIRYKYLLESLNNWTKDMLKSQKKSPDFDKRIKLLERFVDICNAYREGALL